MHNVTDIVVVGQGIIGLSAAIAMEKLGYQVAVVDANPVFNPVASHISRVYAINNASIELLRKIDVWQHLPNAQISAYNRMQVWENKNGAQIEFDSRIIANDKLGVMLEEIDLKKALLAAMVDKNIQLINNYSVEKIDEFAEGIVISNMQGESWSAKLLIVADGARSSLRDKLNVKMTTWSYNQNAIIANVITSKPHQNTAYQVFTKDGPLAFLPQVDNYHSSIVWSVPPAKAKMLMGLDATEFADKVYETFEGKLGALSLKSPRHQFPLQMRHTQQYAGKRWILMGDAAHTIHPLAGLGLNIGLADLDNWVKLLQEHNLDLTANKVLNGYQRQRKHALWQIIGLMQALHVLFTQKITLIAKLTSFGLTAINNITPLKRLIIQQASGSNF